MSNQKLHLKILGSGCKKCQALEENVSQAASDMGLVFSIDHVKDFAQIATYGVMSTPALVINGKVASFGKVLTVQQAKELLEADR